MLLHIVSLVWPYLLFYILGLIIVCTYDWSLKYPFWSSAWKEVFWFVFLPAYAIQDLCKHTMHHNRYLRYMVYKRMYHDINEKKNTLKENSPYGYCWALDAVAPWYMSEELEDYKELMAISPDTFSWFGRWWFDPYDRDIRMRKLLEIINAYR